MPSSKNDRPPQDPAEGEAPAVSSRELLAGGRQLIIHHGQQQYRLLLTSSNKLILTK